MPYCKTSVVLPIFLFRRVGKCGVADLDIVLLVRTREKLLICVYVPVQPENVSVLFVRYRSVESESGGVNVISESTLKIVGRIAGRCRS